MSFSGNPELYVTNTRGTGARRLTRTSVFGYDAQKLSAMIDRRLQQFFGFGKTTLITKQASQCVLGVGQGITVSRDTFVSSVQVVEPRGSSAEKLFSLFVVALLLQDDSHFPQITRHFVGIVGHRRILSDQFTPAFIFGNPARGERTP